MISDVYIRRNLNENVFVFSNLFFIVQSSIRLSVKELFLSQQYAI
jgi:hypothetical protein